MNCRQHTPLILTMSQDKFQPKIKANFKKTSKVTGVVTLEVFLKFA